MLIKTACPMQVLSRYVKGLEISESKPWMLQQFLTGAEYSSYSIAHNGRVVMHSDNEACLSCLDYAHVDSQPVSPLLPQPDLSCMFEFSNIDIDSNICPKVSIQQF